jgi:hypothetical protein
VSKMSTTTPLLTMIEYYTEASRSLVSLWQRQSKAGGRDKAVDVAHTVIYGALCTNESEGEQLDVIMQPMRPMFANIFHHQGSTRPMVYYQCEVSLGWR